MGLALKEDVLTKRDAPQGRSVTACILGVVRIIGVKDHTKDPGNDMRLLNVLLQGAGPRAWGFAEELLKQNTNPRAFRESDARFIELALWGVTAQEWSLAKRAVLIQRVYEQLTPGCPYLTLSRAKPGPGTERWYRLEAGDELRPLVLSDWLGRDVDPVDEIAIGNILKALPDGWSLMILGRQEATSTQTAPA